MNIFGTDEQYEQSTLGDAVGDAPGQYSDEQELREDQADYEPPKS